MKRHLLRGLSGLILFACASVTAGAQQPASAGTPTRVMVRAASRDAKVIGTKVGGARISIRDAATGKVLAEGVQTGETGSTDKIMVQPRRQRRYLAVETGFHLGVA